MILIVADEGDLHARHLRNLIESDGGSAVVLDFAGLADGGCVSFEVGAEGLTSRIAGSEPIDFADVRTVWLRRPAVVRPPASVSSAAARTFVWQEWSAAVNGMAMAQDHLRWVNDPLAQNAASKPRQLHCARKVGLRVPDTVITNDPQRARGFIARHGGLVIHKALTSSASRLLETRVWDEDRDGPHLAALPLAPAIFQRLVPGADVRSVVIGDAVLSVLIDTPASRSAIDSRLDPDADYRAHELPADVAGRLRDLMAALGLVFGVVDLKLTADGEHVFLEANPQGQFLFMEIATGQPISETLASFLLAGLGS